MSTDLDPVLKRTTEAVRPAIVKIHYVQIGMMQVRIGTTDTGALLDELTGRIASAPKFFQRTAVCIDLSDLATLPDADELQAVIDAVRRAGMLSVGLAGTAGKLDALAALATAVNLPILSAFKSSNNPFSSTRPAPLLDPVAPPTLSPAEPQPRAALHATPLHAATLPATAPAVAHANLQPALQAPVAATGAVSSAAPMAAAPAEVGLAAIIHKQAVRSGQRIYARDRDLVITTGVGAGAEVMADGCVHIYGALRGRAMAGVHGQLSARVFCQEFNAELVSIAGVFRVFETIPPELAGKPVQAWLDGDDLKFAPVGT